MQVPDDLVLSQIIDHSLPGELGTSHPSFLNLIPRFKRHGRLGARHG